jgi:hypothetical protein
MRRVLHREMFLYRTKNVRKIEGTDEDIINFKIKLAVPNLHLDRAVVMV